MDIKRLLIAVIFLLFHTWATADDEQVINIAAIDWCPQICPNGVDNGYVVDIVKEIYKQLPYRLNIQYFPWSRAIKLVREGKFHILLSPAKDEAPDLIYPTHAIGQQQMCFFVEQKNNWSYQGPDSLKGLQIGIATDTSIEALNDFKNEHIEQFQFQPYLNRYVEQNVKKLEKGRIDTFLFTKNTTYWELSQLGLKERIKIAGCVSKEDIFVAFTPNQNHQHLVAKLINEFDQNMPQLISSGKTMEILSHYNLSPK